MSDLLRDLEVEEQFINTYRYCTTAYQYHKIKANKFNEVFIQKYKDIDFLNKLKILKKELHKYNIYVIYLSWGNSLEHFLDELDEVVQLKIKKENVTYLYTTENTIHNAIYDFGNIHLLGKTNNNKHNQIIYNEFKKMFKEYLQEDGNTFNINEGFEIILPLNN